MSSKLFAGFRRPYYTQIPNELFDELMIELSSAELRVLLYIMRRTFGFQRDSDAISINQFVDGITKANGEVLDRGCGVSRSAAVKALQSLEQQGYIVAKRQSSARAGNQPTIYSLRFADDGAVSNNSTPLVHSEAQGGSPDGTRGVHSEAQGGAETATPLVHSPDPQKKDLQNTGKKKSADPPKQMDSRPMWERLDPVQDRDTILRNRYARPELPPMGKVSVDTHSEWNRLLREWDHLHDPRGRFR